MVALQESRRITAAVFQHTIYNEYLPLVVGREIAAGFDLLPKQQGFYSGNLHVKLHSSMTCSFLNYTRTHGPESPFYDRLICFLKDTRTTWTKWTRRSPIHLQLLPSGSVTAKSDRPCPSQVRISHILSTCPLARSLSSLNEHTLELFT